MKKTTSGLFLALVLAITTTSAFAADGQIPIVGRSASEANQTTTPTIDTATEVSPGISDYLWTFASIIGQFKF